MTADSRAIEGSDGPLAQVTEPVVPTDRPRYVVGIGASAGGLESLERLFQNLPADTGMAFVVIQHLSPDFKSMMYELLARDTSMPIHRVEDGMPVESNHIYLLPPKKEIVIAEGRLRLTDKDPTKGLTLPIDRFFESLARECDRHAIGIVLSGSGSDGSRGLRAIAEVGGLVISETPETAKFDGMPISARATGLVDMLLPPEEIGPALAIHAKTPLGQDNSDSARSIDVPDSILQGIEAIYELFRQEYDLDFSAYKETTVLRRVHRRMSLLQIPTLDLYADKLRTDAAELNSLYEDLLIGVTQFFRDDEAFAYLAETIIPSIVRQRDADRPIRAWVSACGTGEEAYSLAILFHEAYEKLNRQANLKIFATDVHQTSLAHASRGFYREDVIKTVSPERLARYFTRRGDVYQVVPWLREHVVFAPHNLLRDAPFTDLDFVSCRNLLIYFQPAAQMKALSMAHFALNTDGILFLGSSESPNDLSAEFEVLSEKFKVYRKWRQVRLASHNRFLAPRSPVGSSPVVAIRSFSNMNRRPESGLLSTYDYLLNRFMPPSLLINEDRQLIDTFGGAESLLQLQPRRPSLDVLDLIDNSIRTTVMGAIQRAVANGSQVRFGGVKMETKDGPQLFNLTVDTFRNHSINSNQYLLIFDHLGPAEARTKNEFDQAPDNQELSRTEINRLEEDLQFTKENLQATIEELEASNEELQATNEELVASNEELQSTNEELHSVNEELYTVNAEHQRKISELAEVNHDINHLLENTEVATIFLDRDLRIRKFTTRIRKIFDLIDHDVGRPISSFTHRIRLPDLLNKLEEVRHTGEPFEAEVYSIEGICYLLRILPYRVTNRTEGIVMTLVDLSSLEDLRGRLRWMSAIVTSTNDAIIGEDLNGYITSWNAGAQRLYHYAAEEAIGRHVSFLIPTERRGEEQGYLSQVKAGRTVPTFETIRLDRNGKAIHVSLTVSPVKDESGKVIGISKIARDVTDRITTEQQLREQAIQRERFLAMLSHELRNPLSALIQASRLIDDDRSDARIRQEAIGTISRQSSIINVLLNDLLDVSRISQGKIELDCKPVLLESLIDTVREITSPLARKGNSLIEFEVADRPLIVNGDSTRLVQVLVNLVHNAIKYSEDHKPVRALFRRDGQEAVIEVRDEGVGITPEFLPKIFDAFVQSDETLNRAEGGLGVGLTLVRSLVELHGGSVEAFSEGRNRGSTFVVRLPLMDNSSLAKFESARPSQNIASTPKPMKITIVEDLDDNRAMLKAWLSLDGHEVTDAADGESGYQLITQDLPDVAIVDIGLPGIDGYELARRLRSNDTTERLHLIALTGYGQPSDVARAYEAGFDTHLVKPISAESLMAALDRGQDRS